jgi:lactate dehydrogenase-like 2-hydroxyacid dehydrogenase
MNESRAMALQMNPLSSYLETELAKRFETVRWFERDRQAQEAWLQTHAGAVKAVVAGGNFGISSELMTALPSLGVISINGVGLDKVDLALARDRGVRVTTTPGALTEDVADLAIGLIIGLLRAIPAADAYVRAGQWAKADRPLGRKVSGRRFGIVGLGAIGAAIAGRLAGFGAVAYTGPHRKAVPYTFHETLLSLVEASDVLVLACSANASTRHLIDAKVLAALGPQKYLVNVARGSIVDEVALIDALEVGTLAGAALDVFEDEPNVPATLRANPRTVLTPHIASATVEARARMANMILANLDAYLAGQSLPTAVV